MPGIGGTGVVTVSQMLAAAAKMDGLDTHSVDQTGLSQKAGPVVSTVSIGEHEPGRIDVLIGFDLLASVTPANLAGLEAGSSVVVASTTITPTGRMVGQVATAELDPTPLVTELDARTRSELNTYVDASRLTTGLLGDAVTANVFLLGVAYQAGVVPVKASSIEAAIDLNGTAVELNLQAFRVGPAVGGRSRTGRAPGRTPRRDSADDGGAGGVRGRRRAPAHAGHPSRPSSPRTRTGPTPTATSPSCAGRSRPSRRAGGDGAFTRTVAHQLHRLMAYKDEYEVARLLLDGGDQVERTFGEVGRDIEKVSWNLHPPMLRAMGLQRKLKLGPWARPTLAGLRSMKRLRGTKLDPFGRAEVRRVERRLVDEYVELVDELLPTLTSAPERAAHVAGLVDVVRGYEGVKLRNVETYQQALAEARAQT